MAGLYYPVVTGIMAASNRSASPKDTQQSIPIRTLAETVGTTREKLFTDKLLTNSYDCFAVFNNHICRHCTFDFRCGSTKPYGGPTSSWVSSTLRFQCAGAAKKNNQTHVGSGGEKK